MNEAGIKGIKYDGLRDGECFVVFDDKAVSIIEQYNQQMNGGGRVNRGAITPLSDGRRIVSLFEDADESTFVHEMGHLFLMDLEDLARVDDVSAKELQIVDDWATWKKGAAKEYANTPWAREFNTREKNIIAAEEQGDFETADRLKRQWRQERFARAFELYLRDGKAPARGLRSVFRKFKSYLRAIYSAFTGDGGRASEGVRRVMDRMIATEDEIEAMKLDDRFRDVEAAGGEKLLTEDERDTYARWQKEAREHAKEELMHTVMKDLTEKKQQAFDARLKSERERRVRELQQEPAAIAMQAAQSSGSDEIVLNWFPSKEARGKGTSYINWHRRSFIPSMPIQQIGADAVVSILVGVIICKGIFSFGQRNLVVGAADDHLHAFDGIGGVASCVVADALDAGGGFLAAASDGDEDPVAFAEGVVFCPVMIFLPAVVEAHAADDEFSWLAHRQLIGRPVEYP